MSNLAKVIAGLHDPALPPTAVVDTLNKLLDNQKVLIEDLDGSEKIFKSLDLVLLWVDSGSLPDVLGYVAEWQMFHAQLGWAHLGP